MTVKTIPIEDDVYQVLQKWAERRHMSVNDVIRESVVEYDKRQQEDEQFDAEIDDIVREQAWLLKELENR